MYETDGQEGGEAACWLNQVCEECGRMRAEPHRAVCEHCGHTTHSEEPEGGGRDSEPRQ